MYMSVSECVCGCVIECIGCSNNSLHPQRISQILKENKKEGRNMSENEKLSSEFAFVVKIEKSRGRR